MEPALRELVEGLARPKEFRAPGRRARGRPATGIWFLFARIDHLARLFFQSAATIPPRSLSGLATVSLNAARRAEGSRAPLLTRTKHHIAIRWGTRL
jgi:hypothetical protein